MSEIKSDHRKLGDYLAKNNGRIESGLCLEKTGMDRTRMRTWRIINYEFIPDNLTAESPKFTETEIQHNKSVININSNISMLNHAESTYTQNPGKKRRKKRI